MSTSVSTSPVTSRPPSDDLWWPKLIGESFPRVLDELGLDPNKFPEVARLIQEPTELKAREALAELLSLAKDLNVRSDLKIDTLYIAIHPDYHELSNRDFNDLESWLEQVKGRPEIGLIVVPWLSRPPIAARIATSVENTRDLEKFIPFQFRLYDWEQRTKAALGDRFCYVPSDYPICGFVNAHDDLWVEFLKVRFGASPQKWVHGWETEYLFKQIIVFGQQPNACVANQVFSFGLRNLSFSVEQCCQTPRLPEHFYDWSKPRPTFEA